MKSKLNARHEKFIQGILEGKTQTQAYIDAGYSPKHANANAARLKANDKIRQQIEVRQKEQEEANKSILQAAQEELIESLLGMARDAESEAVRLAAIRDALDRTGMKPIEKLEHSGEVTLTLEGLIKKAYKRIEDQDDDPNAE